MAPAPGAAITLLRGLSPSLSFSLLISSTMRIPQSLQTLVDDGIIEEVLRPLMSGKEAQIYLIVSNGQLCAAKVYKDAQQRSFKNRADYTEGRKVRNSRDQRALNKGSRYGKEKDEEAWKSTEVDTIYKLHNAGVRVPIPYTFMDGVLVMELVCDYQGQPAPRLGDLQFSAAEARQIYDYLICATVRMLSAGIVHGDLSDFNVLLSADGPVVIDFPQSVSAAGNLNARKLLVRDVDNLHRFLSRWVPGARRKPYAEEMWALYESNKLTAETKLTGQFSRASAPVDTSAVMDLIGDANRDEARARRAKGLSTEGLETEDNEEASPSPMRRREVVVVQPTSRAPARRPSGDSRPASGPNRSRSGPRAEHSRADGPRSHSSRRPDERRSHNGPNHERRGPPPRAANNSGPKRGAAAASSTYVSPEARKLKVKALTPRQEEPTRNRRQPQEAGGESTSRPQRGRRNERSQQGRSDSGTSERSQRTRSDSGTSERNQRTRPDRSNGDVERRTRPGRTPSTDVTARAPETRSAAERSAQMGQRRRERQRSDERPRQSATTQSSRRTQSEENKSEPERRSRRRTLD